MTEEDLDIAEKRREAKGKGEKEENSASVLQKVKHRLPMVQHFHSYVYTQEKRKHMFIEKLIHSVRSSIILNSQKVETSQMSIN